MVTTFQGLFIQAVTIEGQVFVGLFLYNSQEHLLINPNIIRRNDFDYL